MNRRHFFFLTTASLSSMFFVSSLLANDAAHASSISTEKRGDVAILHMSGEFTIGIGDIEFHSAVQNVLDQGIRKVVVDMANVTRVDSSMIGELVSGYVATKNRGEELVLCCLSSSVKHVLEITQLITVFKVFNSVNAAVAYFD